MMEQTNNNTTAQVEPIKQAEPKQKNPKRVETGRKGAHARWTKKREAATAVAQDEDKREAAAAVVQDEDSPKREADATPIKITRDTPDEDSPKRQAVNVCKKYIPLASVLLLGFAGMLYKLSKNKARAPVQAPLRPEDDKIDPFYMG